MKLALNKQSAVALRSLAAEIPRTVNSIVTSTEHLFFIYQTVSDQLGIHEVDFRNLLLSIKRAQELSVEVVASIPLLLLSTADKIENYIAHRPAQEIGGACDVRTKSVTDKYDLMHSKDMQIRRRTIFEITALRKSLELTDGDPAVVQAGGAYRDVKKLVNSSIYEVHHIPPQSIFSDDPKSLPTIAMLKQDHAKTSSYRGKMGKPYQPCFPGEVTYPPHKEGIIDLLNDGLLAEAIRNEIYEIRDTFGSKYDGALQQYLNSMVEFISKVDVSSEGTAH